MENPPLQKRCMHPQVVNYQQYLCNIYTLEVQQFAHEKMMAKEDDPFLLGPSNFSGKVKLPGAYPFPFCLIAASTKSQMVLQGENVTFLHILCQIHQHDAQLGSLQVTLLSEKNASAVKGLWMYPGNL